MRALALALVVAISVPGCAMTHQQKRVGYGAGAVAMAIGVAALVAMLQPCKEDIGVIEAAGCGVRAVELYTAGLLFGGAGVATLAVTAASPTVDEPEAKPTPSANAELEAVVVPDQAAPPANLSVAELTRQASTAARIGHCGAVASIADRVELLDPTYRYKGFVADAAIAGCLN